MFYILPVCSNVKTLKLLAPFLSSILEAWFSLILLLFTAPYHIYTNLITVWNFTLKYISNILSYYECIVLGFYLKFWQMNFDRNVSEEEKLWKLNVVKCVRDSFWLLGTVAKMLTGILLGPHFFVLIETMTLTS